MIKLTIAIQGDNQQLVEKQAAMAIEALRDEGADVYRAWAERVDAREVNHTLRITELEVPER